MRVTTTHPLTDTAVTGELIVTSEVARFSPDGEPYGPNHLCIHEPRTTLYGEQDEDCIMVKGLIEERITGGADVLWRRVLVTFTPIARVAMA